MNGSLGFAGAAFAQAQPAAAQGPAPFWASPMFMMILIVGIIYLLIMRPQQKKQKEHQQMLRNLKKGDRVVTMSGIYGTVANLDEKIVLLQVDERAKIKISRQSVSQLSDEELRA